MCAAYGHCINGAICEMKTRVARWTRLGGLVLGGAYRPEIGSVDAGRMRVCGTEVVVGWRLARILKPETLNVYFRWSWR